PDLRGPGTGAGRLRADLHRPGGGGRVHRHGPAAAARPGHADRSRRHRPRPAARHDRQRRRSGRGRRAGRRGARAGRLACLRTPLVVALPAALAAPAPAAARLAVRDLGRHRTRSGAALAAVTFATFAAVLTCVLTSASYANPLTYAGPNLAPNQLIVYEPHSLFHGSSYTQTSPPTSAQQHALAATVRDLATALHASFALELDAAGRPDPSPF